MCSKIDAAQQGRKFLRKQRFELALVPRREQKYEGAAKIPDRTFAPNLTPKCQSRGRSGQKVCVAEGR
jgi:hypothetical protein